MTWRWIVHDPCNLYILHTNLYTPPQEADPVVDPVTAKRKNEAEEPEDDPKKPKLSAEER